MNCPICFEDLEGTAVCLPCGHIFCKTCVDGVTRTRSNCINCPSCRTRVDPTYSPMCVRKVFIPQADPTVNSIELSGTTLTPDVRIRQLSAALDATSISREEIRQDLLRTSARLSERTLALEVSRNQAHELHRKFDTLARTYHSYRNDTVSRTNTLLAENEKQKNEIKELKALLEATRLKNDADSVTVKREQASVVIKTENDWLSHSRAKFPFKSVLPQEASTSMPTSTATPTVANAVTPMFTFKPVSQEVQNRAEYTPINIQSRQVAKLPKRGERPIPLTQALRYHSALNAHSQAMTAAGPSSSQQEATAPPTTTVQSVTSSVAPPVSRAPVVTLPAATPAPAPAPAPVARRELKSGNDILYSGYGRPQHTSVPECTSENKTHHFSGKGTNQYATKYTCNICHFRCSESRR